ncbi:C-type lectin domain family 2 member B-like isoform X5 [Anolis sagrei]|uniref:C-type lectin domain family 2 member B-like isoform X5 n=1 Tax=Anolis sagrei TaxID=38937 RepID=UPI00351FDCB9
MAQRKGHCENGPNASVQIQLTPEFSGNTKASARGLKAKWKKTKPTCILMTVLPLVSSAVTALICVMLTEPRPATCVLSCPSEWIGYKGKCYDFSKLEGTWYDGQNNCSAFGASLVAIEDQKEMDIIMQIKRKTDYWIGLKRKNGQPWEWANGTVFNGWFEIKADGFCAYLDDDRVGSTLCGTKRNWICSKSTNVA